MHLHRNDKLLKCGNHAAFKSFVIEFIYICICKKYWFNDNLVNTSKCFFDMCNKKSGFFISFMAHVIYDGIRLYQ